MSRSQLRRLYVITGPPAFLVGLLGTSMGFGELVFGIMLGLLIAVAVLGVVLVKVDA